MDLESMWYSDNKYEYLDNYIQSHLPRRGNYNDVKLHLSGCSMVGLESAIQLRNWFPKIHTVFVFLFFAKVFFQFPALFLLLLLIFTSHRLHTMLILSANFHLTASGPWQWLAVRNFKGSLNSNTVRLYHTDSLTT